VEAQSLRFRPGDIVITPVTAGFVIEQVVKPLRRGGRWSHAIKFAFTEQEALSRAGELVSVLDHRTFFQLGIGEFELVGQSSPPAVRPGTGGDVAMPVGLELLR
jgi:hypothetical protein